MRITSESVAPKAETHLDEKASTIGATTDTTLDTTTDTTTDATTDPTTDPTIGAKTGAKTERHVRLYSRANYWRSCSR